MNVETPSARIDAVVASALALTSVTVLSAFVRWSRWWPHPDNRQNVVIALGVGASVVGLAALAWAVKRLKQRGRLALLVALVAGAAIGATGGFAALRALTIDYL